MKSVAIIKRGRGRPKKGPDFSEASLSSSTSAGSDSDNNNKSARSHVDTSQDRSQKNQSSSSSSSSSSSTSSSSSMAQSQVSQVVLAGTFGGSSEVPRASEFYSNCQQPALSQSSPTTTTQCVEGRNGDSNLSRVETRWGCFGAGEKVFAYWKGKTSVSTGYYSGTIIQKGVLNVYNINFDDNTVSNTSEAQILPLSVLGVNVKVFYLPDEYCNGPLSALVVGQKFLDSDGSSDNVEYAIQCFGSSETVFCKRRQLYLGVQQAKELRKKYESVQPKFGDVNLDNVILGPRQRVTPKPIEAPAKTKVPMEEERRTKKKSNISGVRRKSSPLKKKRVEKPTLLQDEPVKKKAHSMSEAENCESPCSTTDVVAKNTAQVSPEKEMGSFPHSKQTFQSQSSKTEKQQVRAGTVKVKVPLPSQVHTQSTVKTSTNTPDLKSSKVTQLEEVNKSATEPLPDCKVKVKGKEIKESSTKPREIKGNLFLGYHFFLTAGDRNQMKGVQYVKEISKADMQGMIASHQGKELLSLGDEKNKDPSKVFLLASCHLRTLKYLYCVGTGIPCVAQKWLEDCVNSDRLFDWKDYQLSPGWSLETRELAPPHNNFPLENMTIGLATFKKETIDTWTTLIPAAKGIVKISTDFHHEKQPAEMKPPDDWLNGSIDILVSDFACPKDICETLKSKGIPLVRIEWLVQTIIMGKKSDYRVGEGYIH